MKPLSYKLCLILSLAFFLLACLFQAADTRIKNETAAALLAPNILRFHIMANSDSANDQNIKLEIRSLVLDYMKEQLPEEADKTETSRWIADHQTQIEHLANSHLAAHGFDYTAHLELTNCYFPTRNYDGLIFPCGNYDAARITLGTGKGHNWWCVLYPRYCFLEETYLLENSTSQKAASVPQNNKKDDTLFPKEHRPNVKIQFKIMEILQKISSCCEL